MHVRTIRCAIATALLAVGAGAQASSHREAPFIATQPKVDGADFYAFRSYEAGRDGYVTFIADYLPLQDAYGGPNYFSLDPDALYEIHVDSNGDAKEDLTFQFRFSNNYANLTVPVGGKNIPVPLVNIGSLGPGASDGDAAKNLIESYTVTVVRGDRRSGQAQLASNLSAGGTTFRKPLDNIGTKSIPDYAAYARNHVFSIGIPGCAGAGRVFVGQRKDPFAVNLGEVFDLVNLNPVGAPNAKPNSIADKNITALVLEVPVGCVASGGDPVIGAWTTASLRQARVLNPHPAGKVAGAGQKATEIVGGAWTQVSRLGMPLVNEVVIGLPDKDRFNASAPKDDAQFADYVTNPSLPTLLQVLFNVPAPTVFPRTDLVTAFLTGVPGLNKPASVTPSEMLRLNTSIAPKPKGQQNNLGVLGGDTAGFPNGRRPGDDVVDIELRVAMGVLLPANQAPAGQLPLTDGATESDADFDATFPYLRSPLPGSPASASAQAAQRGR